MRQDASGADGILVCPQAPKSGHAACTSTQFPASRCRCFHRVQCGGLDVDSKPSPGVPGQSAGMETDRTRRQTGGGSRCRHLRLLSRRQRLIGSFASTSQRRQSHVHGLLGQAAHSRSFEKRCSPAEGVCVRMAPGGPTDGDLAILSRRFRARPWRMCTPPGSGTVTCRMTWRHSPSPIVGRTGRPRRLRGRRAEDAVRVEVAARAHLRPGRAGAAYTELTLTAASVVIGGLSVPLAGVTSVEEASPASPCGLTGPASTAGPGGVQNSHHYGGRWLCTTRRATHSGHLFLVCA